MYLYYDKEGTLKEWINDEPLRQGSSGINKVYVFCEKMLDETFTSLWARYKLSGEETYLPSSSTYQEITSKITGQVPYDKKRDLKFFKYFKDYPFFMFSVSDDVLSRGGSWLLSLWLVNDNITTLGQMAFGVDESNFTIKIDENINVAQWNALMRELNALNVPNQQTTTTIVRDVLTNVNGWYLSNYTAEFVNVYGYTCYQIKKNDAVLSVEDASRYMECMTGSKFLPVYDYHNPQNTYLIFADQTLWKPQYDETNGLLLFKVDVEWGGGGSGYGLYYCIFNVTTYANVTLALSKKELPVCEYSNKLYFYTYKEYNSGLGEYEYYFTAFADSRVLRLKLSTNDSWYDVSQYSLESEVYHCTFDTTTYGQITDALSHDKLPVCEYSNKLYIYSYKEYNAITSSYDYYFTAFADTRLLRIKVTSSSVWDATIQYNIRPELFYCTFDSTTYGEVQNALAQNLMPICIYTGKVYLYSYTEDSDYYFTAFADDRILRLKLTSSSVWFDAGQYTVKPELYYCTFNTTTYGQVQDALSHNMLPVVEYGTGDNLYTYAYKKYNSQAQNYYYYFTNIYDDSIRIIYVTSASVWDATTQYNIKPEIFYCTFDTTTHGEVKNALDQGKIPVCMYSSSLYTYAYREYNSQAQDYYYYFTNQTGKTLHIMYVTTSSVWFASTSYTMEVDSNKVTSLSSGSTDTQYPSAKCVYDALANANEIYWCTYGTTSYDEIIEAINNGKCPMVIYSDKIYYFVNKLGNVLYFSCFFSRHSYGINCIKLENNPRYWSTSYEEMQPAAQKVTSISSSSTDTQYPSAKAVYDFVGNIPEHQSMIVFISDILQNINGKSLTAYTSSYGTYGGYAGYKIQKNSTNLTKTQAGEYLTALCGSDFVPEYNYDEPLNSYLIRATDGLIFKPQFDSTNGLVLYEMKKVLTNTSGLPYTTTTPSANNTDGLKIVVLTSEPAVKYDGYIYIITGN